MIAWQHHKFALTRLKYLLSVSIVLFAQIDTDFGRSPKQPCQERKTMKRLNCKTCNTLMEIPTEYLGHQLECPECGWKFLLRGKSEPKEQSGIPSPFPSSSLNSSYPAVNEPGQTIASTPTGLTPRTSRSYTHIRCQTETEVTDPEFSYIANPLSFMERTVCAECGEAFSAHEFAWSDTNERLPDYYKRYLKNVSPTVKSVASYSRSIIFGGGILIGLLASLLALLINFIAAVICFIIVTLIAIVVNYLVFEFIMKNFMLEPAFGTKDVRMLD